MIDMVKITGECDYYMNKMCQFLVLDVSTDR